MSIPRSTVLSGAVACVLAMALAACAPPYRVRVYSPGFTGVRTTVMEGNALSSGALLSAGDIELNLERVDSAGAWTRYWVRLRVLADGPEIHPTMPLTVLLDGDSITLARDSVTIASRYDGVRIDEARYPVARDTLERISAATEGRIRVRIGPWLEERRLYPRNLENLRRFLADESPAAAPASPPR